MKKFAMIVTIAAVASWASATVSYSPSDAITDGWVKLYDGAGTNSITSTDTSPTNGQTSFVGSSTASDASNWWAINIGHEHDWTVDNLDLTGYDEISITVRNNNAAGGDKVFARVAANAGWVPTPGDQYLAGPDTWIDPQAEVTLTLDITGLTATERSQFTKVGIDIGMYSVSQPWDDATGSFTGTAFDVTVVPEPATMTLLGLGGLAALIRRRRRRA